MMADRMIDTLYTSMPWDEIDNVVFDIGNVLVTMDENKVLETLIPDPDLRHEVQLHTTKSPYWNMLDSGALSIEEGIQAMAEGNERLVEPIRSFITGWPDYRTVVAEGRQAVLTCHRHGKKQYVLSNYVSEYYHRNVRDYDFFSLFSGAVISSEVRMLKPRLDIYRYLIETYGLAPARTLFIDDTPANIEAAFVSGWHGFCYNAPGKLSRFLGE